MSDEITPDITPDITSIPDETIPATDPPALDEIDNHEDWEQSGEEISEETSDGPALTGEIDGD